MIKHGSIFLRAGVYVAMVMFMEFGKCFKDVGAAKLAAYTVYDWLVDTTCTFGQICVVLNAYFDRSFGVHMLNGGGPEKSGMTPGDFHKLMSDWEAKKIPQTTENK